MIIKIPIFLVSAERFTGIVGKNIHYVIRFHLSSRSAIGWLRWTRVVRVTRGTWASTTAVSSPTIGRACGQLIDYLGSVGGIAPLPLIVGVNQHVCPELNNTR